MKDNIEAIIGSDDQEATVDELVEQDMDAIQKDLPFEEPVEHPKVGEEGPPVVLSVEKTVSDEGMEWTYDEYASLTDPDKFMGMVGIKDPDAAVVELKKLGVPIEDDEVANVIADDGMYGLMEYLSDKDIGEHNNTRNWSWWGPEVEFLSVQEEGDEAYAPACLFVRLHEGDIDYVMYKLEDYGEEAPWYSARLEATIKTDRGDIMLSCEDDEGYSWNVARDETMTFTPDESVRNEDVDARLDWSQMDEEAQGMEL